MSNESHETNSKSTVKYDLNRFQSFLDKFKRSEFWKAMETTVEDSPWHREANVAVHTEMSMAEAAKWFPGTSDRHQLLTLLSILFHDTGKPPMEVVKENEERGVYRSYANHEQRSARIFEGYVVDNWNEFRDWIDSDDVFTVAWIIEHHLPYGVKDEKKIKKFLSSLKSLPNPEDPEIFFNQLLGDAHGRLSENWEVNTAKSRDWVEEMRNLLANHVVEQKEYAPDRAMYLLVGPPGVGKSTLRNHLEVQTTQAGMTFGVFSLDDLRIKFAQERFPEKFDSYMTPKVRYRLAFHLCNGEENQQEFQTYTDKELTKVVKDSQVIVVDNTNTSVKQRRKYITMAEQKKIRVTAAYFPSSLELLRSRNGTRGDKQLPDAALEALFYAVSLPSEGGEVDQVSVVSNVYA